MKNYANHQQVWISNQKYGKDNECTWKLPENQGFSTGLVFFELLKFISLLIRQEDSG